MKRTLSLLVLAMLLSPRSAEALQVRTDRPRILLSNGAGRGTSLATYRQRCQTAPYKARCDSFISAGADGSFPAINRAAAYLVTGNATRCAEAYSSAQARAGAAPGSPDPHSFISNNQRAMLQLAAVRDWCDPVLSGAQKTWLENRMVQYADWYLANPPYDIFHNDMPNIWASIAEAGLALKGTAQDAKANVYLAAADQAFKQTLLPAFAYVGDWWHEGFTYVQPALATLVLHAATWTIATDEDLFAYARDHGNDLFSKYIDFHAYAMRPDYRYVYFGDSQDPKQSIELFSRYLVDLLTLGTGSPLGQALSKEIEANSRPGYDYSRADGWMMPLFYDVGREGSAAPRATLPRARWMSRGAQDVAILRSGWGRDDTFVYISCGDYLGAHQRLESGSFQMFRHAPLTGTTGNYDAFDTDHWLNYFSQHSVHANTLAVYMPGEFFPTVQSLANRSANVNDGGQRVLRRDHNGTAYNNKNLTSYLARKTGYPFTETGDLKVFNHQARHDYVACDVTAAYASPGFETNGNRAKVREVTRQFVFLPPETLVVFDRVESLDPSYQKRFLLHGVRTPSVDGRRFTITNGGGRLFAQSLLPAEARVNLLTNFEVEGRPHPPWSTGLESGGSRVEVVPSGARLRDYFLNVLTATEASRASGPATSVSEDEESATVTVDDGKTVATVRFAKTGKLDGWLTIQSRANGEVLADGPLDGAPIVQPDPEPEPEPEPEPSGPDAGTPPESGDAGVIPGPGDEEPGADAGTTPIPGADAGLEPGEPQPEAPSCSASAAAGAPSGILSGGLLMLLGLLRARRRNR